MIDLFGGDGFDRISIDPVVPGVFCCRESLGKKQLWFKGGGGGDSVDKEYNARMATIAESQQDMAETYFDFWQSTYKPMEKAQISANMKLIPSETAMSLAQNEANRSQAGLAKASSKAALSLLPGQTKLAKAQTQYGIDSINAKTPVMTAFYNESLTGVDVNDRANKAAADAAQAFAGSTEQVSRNAARRGINPNSGNFASILKNNSIDQAKVIGGAKTQARTNAENENYQRLTTAMGY